MLGYVCISYLLDSVILIILAYNGTISPLIAPSYLACGLGSASAFFALSESGINDRFEDPYLVMPQATIGLTIMLTFAWLAPQAGVLFLSNLFIVFSFSSLRASARETAAIWTAMSVGLAVLFLGTDKPISVPHDTYIERMATMMDFAFTIGRCMFIGIFSNSLRQSLYDKSVQLKEAYRRIKELAELDELTGSFNRRCIMRMLDDEIARAHRAKAPCSIALIDLDWFKRINDAHGHPVGDEVLRTFAISVFANIRGIDRFGRYGGEEFLLILPETGPAAAVQMLDRLRGIVADLDWSALSDGMAVTISAGVATITADETADSVLARADEALYVAKEAGRNQVACA
ncbi:MAG: GGDEF domain-containing protein [Rhizobiales bacterium]|nr:GGDEF domain-containing protein [Hyphomicrobiales bacterium]